MLCTKTTTDCYVCEPLCTSWSSGRKGLFSRFLRPVVWVGSLTRLSSHTHQFTIFNIIYLKTQSVSQQIQYNIVVLNNILIIILLEKYSLPPHGFVLYNFWEFVKSTKIMSFWHIGNRNAIVVFFFLLRITYP